MRPRRSSPLHRSEQVFTSCQSFAHLLRQANGRPQAAQIFYSLYFCMTGLHALHMIIGLGIMTVIGIMAWRRQFDADYYTPVEIAGLYWHFVDIVWIFLFPLLYLIGGHFTE